MSKKSIWITLLSLLLVFSITMGAVAEESKVNGPGRVAKPGIDNQKFIDINEIEAAIRNNGIFANDVNTGSTGLYYPKGQRNTGVLYTSGLWLLGQIDGDIRSAACQYSSEFQPGYILPDGSAVDATDPAYTIFKYNRGDVIEQAALDQGCPDEVIGDQMLYCVYNDLAPHDGVYTKPPIGIEVQQTVWAFNRTGALGKTLFMRYRIINKNVNGDTLTEAYIGVFFDPDLGGANDDAAGCDVELGIGYVYNGTNNDNQYGAGAPAMASDFFQGPIVPSIGEDAVLPNGRVYEDSKVLDMTAFFTFINGSPITGMGDPTLRSAEGAVEAYWFVKGFRNNGLEWEDPIAGGTTKFPLNGDPTTGTGWLYRHVAPPLDVRMGNASGPFTMAPGDTQDVVVGIVVGDGGELGGDNLASVAVMKYYDAQAQQAYDLNFQLPDPPPNPDFAVSTLDGEVVITWDNEADSYADAGYEFEGYNIWIADAIAGPYTRIATYDVANGITSVWDKEFNVTLSNILEQPVQFGTDSGLKYSYMLSEDPRTRDPLINGRPYYFAVTAYGVNELGTPKVLETAKNGQEAVPQRPVLDVQLNAETEQVVDVTHDGPSQGTVDVIVIDPFALTGHNYEVSFYVHTEVDDEGHEHNTTMWKLTDVTTGEDKLVDMDVLGEENPVIDGFSVKVNGPEVGLVGIYEVANALYPDGLPDGPDNVWHSLSHSSDSDLNGRFFLSHQGAHIGDLSQSMDYEIRWTEEGSWAQWGFSTGGFGQVPFELWDIGFATPDDASDDIRMIPICYEDAGTADVWDVPNGAATENQWGYPCSDRIYFYYPEAGYSYDDFAAGAAAGDVGAVDPTWGWDIVRPLGRIVYVNYSTADNSGDAAVGTVVRALTNKPNSAADKFTWTTSGLELSQSADVAKARLEDINVFPNPYFGHNTAEGTFFSQFVTFNNLPAENCVIRIFTLSGVLVTTLEHNDGTPFQKWYLQNDESLPVASGMYIIHVETEFGNKILKLAVVNRQQRYQHI